MCRSLGRRRAYSIELRDVGSMLEMPVDSPLMGRLVCNFRPSVKGAALMEILLALAGLAGLALLLQSKPLPTDDDVLKALKVLEKTPDDPDANTVAGKYKAFVLGDYAEAMQYLAKSSDKTLKALAEHELDGLRTTTAEQKVGMGDEWVVAARKFPALSPIFHDRAAQWYSQAWPKLDGIPKLKLREQAGKVSAARPQGVARKALPAGWTADAGPAITAPPSPDGTIAHTGSYSIKIPPTSDKVRNVASVIRTALLPVTSRKVEASAYVRTDGTENGADVMFLLPFDQNGNEMAPVKCGGR